MDKSKINWLIQIEKKEYRKKILTTPLNIQKKLEIAIKAIDSKKANNIVAMDMHKVSLMADYFVIADATSNRQVQAIVTEVKD